MMLTAGELLTTLQNLSNDELLPVARAFSQFLNRPTPLSNTTAFRRKAKLPATEVIARTLRKLKTSRN